MREKFHCLLKLAVGVDSFHVIVNGNIPFSVRLKSVSEWFRLKGWFVTSVEDTFGVIRVLAVVQSRVFHIFHISEALSCASLVRIPLHSTFIGLYRQGIGTPATVLVAFVYFSLALSICPENLGLADLQMECKSISHIECNETEV